MKWIPAIRGAIDNAAQVEPLLWLLRSILGTGMKKEWRDLIKTEEIMWRSSVTRRLRTNSNRADRAETRRFEEHNATDWGFIWILWQWHGMMGISMMDYPGSLVKEILTVWHQEYLYISGIMLYAEQKMVLDVSPSVYYCQWQPSSRWPCCMWRREEYRFWSLAAK